jgi:adenosylcobinamide-GDP ribazoletransferase
VRARAAGEWASFLLALQFLTRLPVRAEWTPARMAASPRWHPAVGVLVGAATAMVYVPAAQAFPPALAALLSTAAGLLLTGALHEDGFADVCDGLGGGADRDGALQIMRDSRLGTCGAAGLGLMLAAKILALGAMAPAVVPLVLIAGHAASRASAVFVLATSAYVRPSGAASPVAAGCSIPGLAVALATGALALLASILVLPPAAAAGGLLGLLIGHAAMRGVYQRRLAGYTGDCLGAVQQTSETGLYLGVLACL